jgi:D-glycero-alpha-D-manno-heptose-7-phosphate kinase
VLIAQASTPLRVDCGGTLDIALLALWHYRTAPATVNFTLSARVVVSIFDHIDGMVAVESEGFKTLEGPARKVRYDGPLGLYAYLCDMWRVSGVRVLIESSVPAQSGLGGSAAALVATIGALQQVRPLAADLLAPASVALLAYRLESAVRACGPQDHLAAAVGGCNRWAWTTMPPDAIAAPRELLTPGSLPALSAAMVVAYTGTSRPAGASIETWTNRFLKGHDRRIWGKIAENTEAFAAAVSGHRWSDAAAFLSHEYATRSARWPDVITPEIAQFQELANGEGCGAMFAGAGRGGCVWAIGEPSAIARTTEQWGRLAASLDGAALLDVSASAEGLLTSAVNADGEDR